MYKSKNKKCFWAVIIAVITFIIAESTWIDVQAEDERGKNIPRIQFGEESKIITITSWRIIGPFRLPDSDQSYTIGGEERAFKKDYLADIGGSEALFMKIGDPTTNINVDFLGDTSRLNRKAKNEYTFLDQVVDFPIPQVSSYTLFPYKSAYFKVMYAISNTVSHVDADVELIVSGNSPVKIWLNNAIVASPPYGSVGNAQQIQYLKRVHLKKGNNYIMAKMYCFPYLNEFCVRIAERERAKSFIREKGGIRDLVDHCIVEPGRPLMLTRNVLYFNNWESSERNYEIRDAENQIIIKSHIDTSKILKAPTSGLAEGLYTFNINIDGKYRTQMFYIGYPDKIYSTYKRKCESHNNIKSVGDDSCLSLAGLHNIKEDAKDKGFRLDWQKKAIVYSSMIENGINGNTYGFRMHSYLSRVDGQYQYFLFYRPKTVSKKQPVPLVIEVPHNAYGTIASQDPEALLTKESPDDPYYKLKTQCLTNRDANYLLRLAMFCDEYGYACLFPFARNRQFEDPVAITDMLEVMEAAKKVYAIDNDRIYLRGFCRGGGNSIKLAEHFPDQFAAISSINLNVDPEPFSVWNIRWRTNNNIASLIDNIKAIPLQLVHGSHFPHSPIKQSLDFMRLCKNKGVPAQLSVLKGDTQWDEKDEYRISFEFFRDKRRARNPDTIIYKTGQLKYSSAYWVRINSLIEPFKIGSIEAQREQSGRISITTQNVGGVEILRENFPDGNKALDRVDVVINGLKTSPSTGYEGRFIYKAHPDHQGSWSITGRMVEGPVAMAVSEPFIIVQGTGGGNESQTLSQRFIDDIEMAWRRSHLVTPRRKYDYEVTIEDLRQMNIILVGEISGASKLQQACDKIPLSIQGDSIAIGDLKYIGENAIIVMLYPNPEYPKKMIVLIKSVSNKECAFPEPDLARYGADVAIFEIPEDNGKPALVRKWIWDNSWRRLFRVM
jgi:hypothetical protein